MESIRNIVNEIYKVNKERERTDITIDEIEIHNERLSGLINHLVFIMNKNK